MAGAPTTVTVTMKSKPHLQQRLKQVVVDLTDKSRAEDGCIAYYWQQSLEDPNTFLLYMIWRDEDAFNRHVQSPHVKEFDDTLGAVLLSEPYVLTRWEQLS